MGYQPSGEEAGAQPVSSKKDLVDYFHRSCKKRSEMMIGMEVEMHGVHTDTLKPITYLEKKGMRSIQDRLIEHGGWQVEKKEGKYIIAIGRGGSSFDLESSEDMAELASRVHYSIHGLASEWRRQMNELAEMSRVAKVAWLGIGYQPFISPKEVRDVKIKRFLISGEQPVKKKLNGDEFIWRNIASVQTNVDYQSEEDARQKFQTLLRLAPLVSAMFAHAPIKEGKDSQYVSYRTHIFRNIYPWRSGLRESFFRSSFGFEDWVDFCLEVPMIAIFRDGEWIRVTDITFAQFLKQGFQGQGPTIEDWIVHLSFIYTDARIKNYIELRVCDSLPPALVPSVQALTKAFVYHKDGERAIKEITKGWTFDDFQQSYEKIAERGMQASVHGKKMLDYCKEVLETATALLRSRDILDEDERDESAHLRAIKHFVFIEEKSPGEWLRDKWNGPWKQNPEKLIEWCQLKDLPNVDL